MSDIDVIRQAIEERDEALQRVELMASETVYRGNSVQHWHAKATAYGDKIMEIWAVLREGGVKQCGDVVATVSALRAERDELLGMREEVLHYQREFHRLRSRLAEAERDAARYRWLRVATGVVVGPSYVLRRTDELDAAIDAAMEGGE